MKSFIDIAVSKVSAACCLFLWFSFICSPSALSQSQSVDVVVYLEETSWNRCGDLTSSPDMYYEVTIDGRKNTTSEQSNCCTISPWDVDQEVSERIDIPRQNNTVPIIIAQYDSDPGDDELCDLFIGDHRRLYLSLDLLTGEISGDATGTIDQSIETGEWGEEVYFKFKISLREPVSYSSLNMRCLHDPIWPQPGETVTITATALDGYADPIRETVDNIEIYEGDSSNVVASTATTATFGSNQLSYSFTPPDGAELINYFCRVTDNGLAISGPWRTAQIGNPPPYPGSLGPRRAVPVLYRGAPNSAIDICFIPNRSDYSGASDPSFIQDVGEVIRDIYYADSTDFRPGGLTFLTNQDKLNFWITLRTGTLEHDPPIGDSEDSDGPGDYPEGWDTTFSFCDAGAIVHRWVPQLFRDGASMEDHIFTASIYGRDSFLHELGHTPFGLFDEYCCDGGYKQTKRRPNIYEKWADCMNDALVGTEIGEAEACSEIVDSETGESWFRLDRLSGNDLMQQGDMSARPADLRRIDHMFNKCQGGGC